MLIEMFGVWILVDDSYLRESGLHLTSKCFPFSLYEKGISNRVCLISLNLFDCFKKKVTTCNGRKSFNKNHIAEHVVVEFSRLRVNI